MEVEWIADPYHMTPKSKSEQLLAKYQLIMSMRSIEVPKQCTVLLVDEMIKTFQHITNTYSKDFQKSVDFWLEVRKELVP